MQHWKYEKTKRRNTNRETQVNTMQFAKNTNQEIHFEKDKSGNTIWKIQIGNYKPEDISRANTSCTTLFGKYKSEDTNRKVQIRKHTIQI